MSTCCWTDEIEGDDDGVGDGDGDGMIRTSHQNGYRIVTQNMILLS